MGLDPERLNVFVASLKRHSPHTRLVVFVEEQTDSKLLKAAGAEVIPFEMPSDSALVLHRWAGQAGVAPALICERRVLTALWREGLGACRSDRVPGPSPPTACKPAGIAVA